MSDVDFSGLHQAEMRSLGSQGHPASVSDYAPRRARQSVAIRESEKAEETAVSEEPLSEQIRRDSIRFATMVANLQESERQKGQALLEANARIEQYEIRVTHLTSELETARLETADANRRTEDQRVKNARLKAGFEQVGGTIADMLHGEE